MHASASPPCPPRLRTAAFLLLGVPLAVLVAVAVAASAQGSANDLYTLDLTGPDGVPDGLVDAVELEFNVNVDKSTIRPGDFVVDFNGQEIVPKSFSDDCGLTDATTHADCFRLHFRQVTAFTGRSADLALIEVTYQKGEIINAPGAPAGTLNAPLGKLLDGFGAPVDDAEWKGPSLIKDGAGPVLLGAFAHPDLAQIYAVFSEDVAGSVGGAVTKDQFELCSGSTVISDVVSSATTMTSNARVVEIGLTGTLGDTNFATGWLVAYDWDGATVAENPCPSKEGGASEIVDADGAFADKTEAVPLVYEPAIRRVLGEEGSRRVLVEFWAPVGTGANGLSTVRASDLGAIGAQGGSGASIQDAIHVPGHRVVELSLDRGLSGADMAEDANGFKVKAAPNAIRGYANHGGMVSYTEEPFAVDTLAPELVEAITVDKNGNGLIDAIRLEFTEVVTTPDPSDLDIGWAVRARDRDSLTPGGSVAQYFQPAPGPWEIVGEGDDAKAGRLAEELPIAAVVKGGNGGGKCETSYTEMTKVLYICFDEGTILRDEVHLKCRIDGEAATQVCLGTGQEPAVSYTAGIAGEQIRDTSNGQNRLDSIDAFVARDRTLPVILDACTGETGTRDGYIDGYAVLFSEPMQGSLNKRDWQVQGRIVDDTRWAAFPSKVLAEIIIEPGDESDGDPRDTGQKPNLNYQKASQSAFLYDARKDPAETGGNSLPWHQAGHIVERDCAPPFMYEVFGVEASQDVTVRFSEPVAFLEDPGGANEELVDLPSSTPFYRNHNNQGAGTIETGSFEHTRGADSFTFRVTNPLHAADVDPRGANTDAVLIAEGQVFQNTMLPILTMPNSEKRMRGELLPDPDTQQPPKPSTITVKHGTDPATQAELSFAALVDPPASQSNAGIAKYEVRYHTQQLGTNAFGDQVGTLFTVSSGIETSGTQELVVTGLTPETDYWFAVRAVDKSGNEGDSQVTTTKHTTLAGGTGPVGGPPSKVGTITATANANSVTLSFACPQDDADGIVAFPVRASDEAFTAADYTSKVNELGGATARTTGASATAPCAAGDPVTIRITGLESSTQYWFSVVAHDEEGLKSSPSDVVDATTTRDTTEPPRPDPTRVQPTGDIRTTDRVLITWPPVTDPESAVLQYVWSVDSEPATQLTLEGAGTTSTPQPRAEPTNLGVGNNWFHVAAVSAGGISDTAHLPLTVKGAATVTDSEVTNVNRQIQGTVKAVRSGDNVQVTWQVPDDVTSLDGVQVWCMQESGRGTLIRQLGKEDPQYGGGAYTDVDSDCTGGYAVTGYHTGDVGLAGSGDSGDIPGFASLEPATIDEDGGGIPMWLIIVLAAAGALILVAVVLFVVLRGRKGGGAAATTVEETDEAQWDAASGADEQQLGTPEPAAEPTWGEEPGADEPAWADDEGTEPAWADDAPVGATAAAGAAAAQASAPAAEDTGIHQVTCPECNEVFVAEGNRPLRIECPNCGVQGMLS